ncbi:MAG: hypothetical protein A2622_07465 [Bdellovibrionales bacterium RIFCSPHIGHO2_01_FULL_40_29]|nr:MAG: hypothetical protein A2622_07465 [Bdellovibrionales bacterium RIFCSPHIGHO2_01_FULL_40_29]OFZ34238.1 MAG: hypothetical protein A3D17_04185 [Bdellovibrionales bacterium RIFCSPHIGHO2_02_FULL_40_15]
MIIHVDISGLFISKIIFLNPMTYACIILAIDRQKLDKFLRPQIERLVFSGDLVTFETFVVEAQP